MGSSVKGALNNSMRLTALRAAAYAARLNLRGREKVSAPWHLYCMARNIEKLANSGWAR